ncbi:hypothetical protein XMIN_4564 [Xanthomonas citri pv. mangiferaeindicae LMG 941]|nr:hypothetical protein XMIN_4564 [Xanthomonas citri pv. mangiferaeindicae LMG 941]
MRFALAPSLGRHIRCGYRSTWNAWSAGGMRRETNIGSNSLARVIVGSRSCCRQPVTTGPDTLMNSVDVTDDAPASPAMQSLASTAMRGW